MEHKQTLEVYTLNQYLLNKTAVERLSHEIADLGSTIADLDSRIELADETGTDSLADRLCEERNNLNLRLLSLKQKKRKLKSEIYEFEKVRQLTR
jgi:predicted  nucleic acid-binding Zn-ribbon protein